MTRSEESLQRRRQYNREYRQKNREAILAREKQYREENPEKVRAATQSYRSRNREKVAAVSAAWYALNRGKVAEHHRNFREANKAFVDGRVKAWQLANQEKVVATKVAWRKSHRQEIIDYRRQNQDKFRVYAHNRRQRMKRQAGALSVDIIRKLLVLQRSKCPVCKISLEDGYHLDHTVPLAKNGAHDDLNMQLLCPTCNVRKNAKDPVVFMQERGFLL